MGDWGEGDRGVGEKLLPSIGGDSGGDMLVSTAGRLIVIMSVG